MEQCCHPAAAGEIPSELTLSQEGAFRQMPGRIDNSDLEAATFVVLYEVGNYKTEVGRLDPFQASTLEKKLQYTIFKRGRMKQDNKTPSSEIL